MLLSLPAHSLKCAVKLTVLQQLNQEIISFSFLVEKRRRKNMSRQKNVPELYPTATYFNEEDKEGKISSDDSKSKAIFLLH